MMNQLMLRSIIGKSCYAKNGINYHLKRLVSSLGPLASAFNTRPTTVGVQWRGPSAGLFQVPELKDSQGFYAVKDECVQETNRLVQEACDPNRTRNIAVIFDDMSDELCRVADLAEFIRVAHPDSQIALAAQDACIDVSALVEELNTNLEIYNCLKLAVEQGDRFPESEVDKHVAKLFLQDFKQCGIHLNENDRQKVVAINDRILRAGQEFSGGCHEARAVDSQVLPAQIRPYFPADGNRVIVSGHNLDTPNEMAREAAYKIFYWPESQQEQLLTLMLNDRKELAQLCGYKTFAHRALAHSLAETPENMADFLTKLKEELPSRVGQDHHRLTLMKRKSNPMCQPLALWDVPYYSALARAEWFKLDTEKVAEYFSLGVTMQGLNDLFESLYGTRLVVERTLPGELWSPDVFKLAVMDGDRLLGHIYCDFFVRPGKPHQDCHFTIRGGRELANGDYQNPVVVLMLNFPAAGWRTPTLLSPGSVDNLFHEMGHAMHSMLGRTKYQHVTGTRCSTDFAEVPSTLMEYFSADPRVLSRINKHYRTGESLPESVIEKLCATKKILAGVELQSQLVYAAVDQAFHGADWDKENETTCTIMEKIQNDYHTLQHVPGTAPHLRFSHLVGYGARYYSYLLARSVASAIWQNNFYADPFSRDAGIKYREECLSHGGGKRSLQLVSDYLSAAVQPTLLASSLLEELDGKMELVESLLKRN